MNIFFKEQTIAGLIFKRFKSELTDAEKHQLDEWAASSPKNKALLDSLEGENAFFKILEQDQKDKEMKVEDLIFKNIIDRIKQDGVSPGVVKPFKRRHIFRWSYAAAVILLTTMVTLFWIFLMPSKQKQNQSQVAQQKTDRMPGATRATLTLSDGRTIALDADISNNIEEGGVSITNKNGELLYNKSGVAVMNKMTTARGGQYKVVLSDGTQVWMNSASSLVYPTFFKTSTREVEITGEVYFEVAKNKKQPFVVKVPGGAKIEVLGTSFNVNAYADESSQVTTLVDGSIRVSNENEKIMVSPGQQALFDESGSSQKKFRIQDANMEQALAWRNNFFLFNKTSLPDAMRQLSRWYNLDIQYRGKVPVKSFHGKIPRDIPLSQVLSALAKMDIHFEINGNALIVSSGR